MVKSPPIWQQIQVYMLANTAILQEIWNHLNCVPRKSDKKKHPVSVAQRLEQLPCKQETRVRFLAGSWYEIREGNHYECGI